MHGELELLHGQVVEVLDGVPDLPNPTDFLTGVGAVHYRAKQMIEEVMGVDPCPFGPAIVPQGVDPDPFSFPEAACGPLEMVVEAADRIVLTIQESDYCYADAGCVWSGF